MQAGPQQFLGVRGARDSKINQPCPLGGGGGQGSAPRPGVTRAARQWNHPHFLMGRALC